MEERRLGNWIKHQRMDFRAERLSPEHVMRLEGLGGWSGGATRQQGWDSTLLQLEDWLTEHDGVYPSRYTDNPLERKLAKLVMNA